jgi:hypothetical protein
MKSGPRFTVLFVAVTVVLFAALILAQALDASRFDGWRAASAVLALAVAVVLALAYLAAILIRALHEGRA